MKKILSVMLAMIMVLAMGVVSFASEPAIEFWFGEVEAIEDFERFDTFKLPIEIKNNPGFASVQITVDYDKDALELIGIELGLIEGVCNVATGKIAGATAQNVTGDGVLYTLEFKVLSVRESYTVDTIVNEFYNAQDEELIPADALFVGNLYDVCAHNNVRYVDGYEATCCENGYEGDIYCANCGGFVDEGEVIPATGEHNFSEWEADPADPCTEHRYCQYDGCNEVETREDHEWGDWEVVKEATKTEKGLKKRVCSVCGDEETKEIPRLRDTSDGPIPGVTVKDPSKTEGEANPNTGAPVIAALAVVAAAVVLGKKR